MAVTQGERIAGGFILITGIDGIRYAVRPQSVGITHDADECRDETMIQLHGGHVVRVPCPMEEVLAWFYRARGSTRLRNGRHTQGRWHKG
jgi:hypothetical protein